MRAALRMGLMMLVMGACGRSQPAPTAPTPAPEATAAAAPTPVPEVPPPADKTAPEAAPSPDETAPEAAQKPETANKPTGKIRLIHKRPGSSAMRGLAKDLKESQLFAEVIDSLNKAFHLPRDLAVHFEDCGEANAFYDTESKKISMCWELLEHTVEQFAKEATSEEEAAAGFIHATIFTFFHELGHALIDVLDLPVTGKEEDVVDQLATWILVAGGEDGALMAIDGALSFLDEEGDDEPATWGEHSLDQQRFYNIVCWVYGSKPERYTELTEAGGGPLPEERAERCSDEWTRLSHAWTRLLADHVRD